MNETNDVATYTLRGLADAPAEVAAASVASSDEAVARLAEGWLAVTAAGCDGAITVWRTNGGDWRCERSAYGTARASATYGDLSDVGAWLASEWANIGDRDTLATPWASW